jgi:hypothetical protein
MKVIIKYNPEYKTPVKVHEVEEAEDAWDLIDEAEQGFGQGIILTDQEFEQLLNQNKDEDKYPLGYLPKIKYWTTMLEEALEEIQKAEEVLSTNSHIIIKFFYPSMGERWEKAKEKLEYFLTRQIQNS